MTPILGILDSAKYANLNSFTGNFVSIQTYTVTSGGATSITFSSIPTGYTHLQLRGIMQLAESGSSDNWAALHLNGTLNTYQHTLYGNGSSASAAANGSTSDHQTDWFIDGPQSGNTHIFAAFVTDILDYQSTTKNKTMRTLSGFDANGSGYVNFTSQLSSVGAVTDIEVFSRSGSGFSQYSSFALYGIR
jgi:hypothetical protein